MPTPVRSTLFGALACLVAAGCSAAVDDGAPSGAALLGVATGQDGADRACDVVLRSVARPAAPTGGGFLTNCLPGGCFYVWEGTLDLSASAVAAGATPTVMFQTTSASPTWFSVPATPVDGAAAGAQRYTFKIDHDTVTDGMSTTSLNRTVLQVEPLVTLPDGSRLFDHNRNADPTGNYVLTHDNFWSIADDASVCAPPASATLRFLGDWRQLQEGAIVAGGNVTVDYELARLPQCNGSSYQGEPAWGISGFARFSPGGQVVSGPLTQYQSTATGGFVVAPTPWSLTVPRDATGVELWFETSGETCSTFWDSNYGHNYAFAVAATATPASVSWGGNWRSMVSRGCMDADWMSGVAEPLVLDSWALTRATCIDVDAEILGARPHRRCGRPSRARRGRGAVSARRRAAADRMARFRRPRRQQLPLPVGHPPRGHRLLLHALGHRHLPAALLDQRPRLVLGRRGRRRRAHAPARRGLLPEQLGERQMPVAAMRREATMRYCSATTVETHCGTWLPFGADGSGFCPGSHAGG